jgi:CheY-like chemotaxis protein
MDSDRYTLLIVDDDSHSRALLVLLFEQHQYTIIQAADGDSAIEIATQRIPDLILLDIALPRRNGREVYEVLQKNPQTAHIPIIVMSAALPLAELEHWRSRPAIAAVRMKPFDIFELDATISALLKRGA